MVVAVPDQWTGIVMYCSHCVGYAVTAKLRGIVQQDFQSGPDSGANDHNRFAGQPGHSILYGVSHRGNY